MRCSQATDYKLDFVLPHAGVLQGGGVVGTPPIQAVRDRLDQAQRLNMNPDDGLVLMNIGAIRAKLQLSLGSPDKALASLEQYDNDHATVGMEAEYKAWWSLALACANEPTEALRVAKEAEGMTVAPRSPPSCRGHVRQSPAGKKRTMRSLVNLALRDVARDGKR